MIGIKDPVHAELPGKSLSQPVHSGTGHARLTEMPLQPDEREDLTPEEEALAEVASPLSKDYEEK